MFELFKITTCIGVMFVVIIVMHVIIRCHLDRGPGRTMTLIPTLVQSPWFKRD
ncbi:hypothetical protein HanIR_Chr14g0694601 [Helianthus annuus]|nr:hypothetical protein HanIR_Chr14g0694601 [Helianthus annuus]